MWDKIFLVLCVFGAPLHKFMVSRGFSVAEEKYAPIRPSDAFVPMVLCGVQILLILGNFAVTCLFLDLWLAIFISAFLVLISPFLIKIVSKMILDRVLANDLKINGPMN